MRKYYLLSISILYIICITGVVMVAIIKSVKISQTLLPILCFSSAYLLALAHLKKRKDKQDIDNVE